MNYCGIDPAQQAKQGHGMKPTSNQVVLGSLFWLLSGCASVNESAWHSLKARDALAHPAAESQRPSEKAMSYDDYARERKVTLEAKPHE